MSLNQQPGAGTCAGSLNTIKKGKNHHNMQPGLCKCKFYKLNLSFRLIVQGQELISWGILEMSSPEMAEPFTRNKLDLQKSV